MVGLMMMRVSSHGEMVVHAQQVCEDISGIIRYDLRFDASRDGGHCEVENDLQLDRQACADSLINFGEQMWKIVPVRWSRHLDLWKSLCGRTSTPSTILLERACRMLWSFWSPLRYVMCHVSMEAILIVMYSWVLQDMGVTLHSSLHTACQPSWERGTLTYRGIHNAHYFICPSEWLHGQGRPELVPFCSRKANTSLKLRWCLRDA